MTDHRSRKPHLRAPFAHDRTHQKPRHRVPCTRRPPGRRRAGRCHHSDRRRRRVGDGVTGVAPKELEGALVEGARLIRNFYDGLEHRDVAPDVALEDTVAAFHGTLDEDGVGLVAAMRDVETLVLPHAMGIPHPLYLGLINSSPLAGGIVAESIVGALNNNAGAWEQSPPFAAAEEEVLRCLRGVLGLPPDVAGIVLPGGSYTALHGLQLARDVCLPEWRAEGPRALTGNPRVYVSDASHFSAVRAAIAIGVAPKDVVRIPTTGRGAIDARAFRRQLDLDRAHGERPFALVATLGTTGTGAIDPIGELAADCDAFGVWLHVDACYGGAAVLAPDLGNHFAALAQADSVAVDPHKWFFVPMVAGLLFTRHRGGELETFDIDASYIPDGDRVDGYRRALPTSRRAAGFPIWMALRAHGLRAVREAVVRNIELARRLEEGLSNEGFRVMPGGELSIACARYEPSGWTPEAIDDLQREIAAAAVRSGMTWFGTVSASGEAWLRFCVVNTFTREHHIDALVQRLSAIAVDLRSGNEVPCAP